MQKDYIFQITFYGGIKISVEKEPLLDYHNFQRLLKMKHKVCKLFTQDYIEVIQFKLVFLKFF